MHVLLNPFTETQYQFRLSVLFISLLCPIIFFFLLREKNKKINKYLIVFISSLILLSPYFRTSAFWGLGENYAVLSLLITYFLFQKLNFIKTGTNNMKLITLFLLALSSSLVVYFDQKLLIIPSIVFVSIILNKRIDNKSKILVTSFFLIFSMPMLYLIFLWNSILPPSMQMRQQGFVANNILNIGYASTIISFYLLPFIFFQKKKIFLLISDFFKRKNSTVFILFFCYLLLVLIGSDLYNISPNGKGLVHKFANAFIANATFQLIFTLFAFFFSWVIINMYIEKSVFDKIIIYYFLIISFFIQPLHQEYFDPIILILIFTFLQKKIIINFKNMVILGLYLSIFLVSTNSYYKSIS